MVIIGRSGPQNQPGKNIWLNTEQKMSFSWICPECWPFLNHGTTFSPPTAGGLIANLLEQREKLPCYKWHWLVWSTGNFQSQKWLIKGELFLRSELEVSLGPTNSHIPFYFFFYSFLFLSCFYFRRKWKGFRRTGMELWLKVRKHPSSQKSRHKRTVTILSPPVPHPKCSDRNPVI